MTVTTTIRSQTILVAASDAGTLDSLSRLLAEHGFAVTRTRSVAELLANLAWFHPDLVLLDTDLSDGDGLEIACSLHLRERSGVVFVSARINQNDLLRGLELGGDDFVMKPVNPRELIARIDNVLRLRAASNAALNLEGWNLDLIRRELFQPDGTLLALTSGEFNILAALAAVRSQPLSRDFLLDVISNRDPRQVRPNTVDTLIVRLRRKLQPNGHGSLAIVTVRGVGYALEIRPSVARPHGI